MRRAVLLIVPLALTACPHPVDPSAIQFWSLVEITTDEEAFAFKCLHRAEDGSRTVACFTPVEIPLFTVEMDGHAVETTVASDVVADRMPFDPGLIGRDVWRAHVASADADLAAYNEASDPDVPEDRIEIDLGEDGHPVEKRFFAGETLTARVRFLEREAGHAGRIVLESFDPPYTIEIVQGDVRHLYLV